ncbi:MAG: lactonase family protein [Pseudomonadota bacterium]|nr:lactonase family protein [Pseudomonadota bacterium]
MDRTKRQVVARLELGKSRGRDMKNPRLPALIAFVVLCAGCGGNNGSMTPGNPKPARAPMVFTMTNATTGNSVQVYSRSSDGTLVNFQSLSTGGTGVGHGLENQGAVALSRDGQFLYVVNPGSNDLTAFQVMDTGVQLTDRIPSGGILPVSVAEWNGIVYVLNRNGSSGAGSGPTIQGFQVSTSGILSPIAGSVMALRATDTNAAQIAISPDGLWILVTERGINEIDVVPLDQNHAPGTPRSAASAGSGPFGFAFSDAARLYVSEIGMGTTSAYDVDPQGILHVLSAAVSTQQRATCWLVITPDNNLVYVSNTSNNSLSSYRIAMDGSLTGLVSVAATTAGRPLDLVVSADGNFLSVLATDGSIETFHIDATSGSLTSIQTVTGLPAGTNGLTGP